uniref:CSON000849 protein n=1 Tax=Culicoides sonorensis TaxID=179676 RepID=A0A336MT20_CULSO
MLPGIGIFGTSEVTKVLVPFLREKGFNIVGLWGPVLKEAEEVAKVLTIPFYTNRIDDVLLRKDVDLIFVLCPPYLHSQISVKALGIGKHVMCDKPFGISQLDALKMVKAGQYYPSLISIVNYSLRFLPAFAQMKKAIADGYIGNSSEISLIDIRVRMGSLLHSKYDWLCDSTMGGGILNLVGSHVIDLVSFLTDKKAVKVHGVVRTYTTNTSNVAGIRTITAPDFCTFQLELESGILVTANLHSHTSSTTFNQEVLVCGPSGHLTVRGGDLIGHKLKGENNELKEEVLYLDVQDLANSDTSLPKPYVKGLYKMVGNLASAFHPDNKEHVQGNPGQVNWIKTPVQLAANFEDGLYVQAVLDAIRKSSDERAWKRVQIVSESPNSHAKYIVAARMGAKIL